MARDYWFIADPHFGHANCLKFLREDGTLMRPGFTSVEEMDELMIQNWNERIKPQDYVYVLGDVTFDYEKFDRNTGPRLMGHKRLIVGNHDYLYSNKFEMLRRHFQKIRLWHRMDEVKIVFTHFPLHESQFNEKYDRNVHGHVHYRTLKNKRYACVSVEMTEYKPVHLDELNDFFGK
jgi:calcineurin-like phosphoesterase family protein